MSEPHELASTRRRRSSSASQHEGSRKNGRRSTSPHSKSAVHTDANGTSVDDPTAKQGAADLDWFARDFQPAQLFGAQAAKWRSMVISDMFRAGSLYVAQPQKDRWLPSPAWNTSPLPAYEVPPIAVSYLVVGPEVRGQFLPEEAKKQGVKPGPDFARLTKGEEVLLPDGTPVDLSKCFTPGALSSVSLCNQVFHRMWAEKLCPGVCNCVLSDQRVYSHTPVAEPAAKAASQCAAQVHIPLSRARRA